MVGTIQCGSFNLSFQCIERVAHHRVTQPGRASDTPTGVHSIMSIYVVLTKLSPFIFFSCSGTNADTSECVSMSLCSTLQGGHILDLSP